MRETTWDVRETLGDARHRSMAACGRTRANNPGSGCAGGVWSARGRAAARRGAPPAGDLRVTATRARPRELLTAGA